MKSQKKLRSNKEFVFMKQVPHFECCATVLFYCNSKSQIERFALIDDNLPDKIRHESNLNKFRKAISYICILICTICIGRYVCRIIVYRLTLPYIQIKSVFCAV